MSTIARERLEFAPPPTPGMVRAMTLAVLAHGVLLAALTLGVQWKREATPVTVQAELWSSVPVQAAPPAPEEPTQPEPPIPVEPKPELVVAPKPLPKADPAIAVAKEKEKARLAKEKQLQQEKATQEKAAQEKLKEKLAQEKAAADKLAKEKAAKRADEAKALEADRQKALKRMLGMAGSGGSGEAGSTGSAQQSAGPSASYAGRVVGRIRPNITFTDSISGNPRTLVEIRTSPDGTIIVGKVKILQSSGVKAWDDAVLNAILKTEILPKDVDGRVPPVLEIGFRPKD